MKLVFVIEVFDFLSFFVGVGLYESVEGLEEEDYLLENDEDFYNREWDEIVCNGEWDENIFNGELDEVN